jgi:hypothetical protein
MLLVTEPVVDPVPMLTVPPEMAIGPVNVLSPLIVSVPEPAFVNWPPAVIAPLNVVDELSPPAVRSPASNRTVPAPAIDPTVSLTFRVNVAPVETDTAVEFDSLSFDPDKMTVPVEIVVEPV